MKNTGSARSFYKLTTALALVMVLGACSGNDRFDKPTASEVAAEQDDHSSMLLRYCRKLRKANDLRVAASMCQRAYTVKPTEAAPLFELADIYGQLGDLERKATSYRLALQIDPEDIDALYGLAKTEMDQGRYDVAVAQLEHALQIETDDARIYNAIGIAKDQLGEHESAQALYRTGLTIDPDNVPLRNNLGLSLSLTGNHAESVALLRDVAKSPSAGDVGSRNLAKAAKSAAQAREDMAANFDSDEPMELFDGEMGAEAPDAQTALRLEKEGFPMEPAFELAMAQPEAEQVAAMSKPLPDDIENPDDIEDPDDFWDDAEEWDDFEDPMAIPARPGSQIGSAGGTLAEDGEGGDLAARMPAPRKVPAASQVPTPEELARALDEDGEPEAAMKAPASSTGISFTVQVGSYGSKQGAERGWKVLTGNAAELLGSQPHTIVEAEVGDAQVYRLRAGDMAERSDADNLCGELKKQDIGCYVVRLPEAAPVAKAAPAEDQSES